MKGLRLALLAPIAWPTPPPGYGPWEQVASNIAEGMLARGLDVTLFATGNSTTAGKLASVVPVGLNEDPALDGEICTALHVGALFERASDFDLIHNNFDWKPLTYALATSAPPLVTTIHGFSSPPVLAAYYAGARRSFYCSISDADRDPGLAYLATTYNGIDPVAFDFVGSPGDYLVFLGRFHPEKGTHLAIEVARRAGVRLKIAAIHQDHEYFKTQVLPHIDGDRVQFLGAVGRAARNALLGGALGLVHMTTRPERFGLTMIEAMACGTPVLGARLGSIPEIVIDGETGFLCDSVAEAAARVPVLRSLDRHACRARVERAFSIERMIDRYLDAYRSALELGTPPPPSQAQRLARAHDYWDRPMAFTDLPPKPRSLGRSGDRADVRRESAATMNRSANRREPRAAGVYAAVLTPFEDDGMPSLELLVAHCRLLLAAGAHGLSVLGTTGEANSLTVAERMRILEGLIDAGLDPAALLPGTGCCALDDTVTLTQGALALGITRVLMLPPFYYKSVDDEGLFAAYSTVVERVADARLQIYLYNIPQLSGIALGVGLVTRLQAAYGDVIAGVKDSSRSLESLLAYCRLENFTVLAGTERLLVEALAAGGSGCIAALVNTHAADVRRLYDLARGDAALERTASLARAGDVLERTPFVASLKAVVAEQTGDARWRNVRPPLRPLHPDERERCLSGLAALAIDSTGAGVT